MVTKMFGRIRVDLDQVDLLKQVLVEARNRRIELKIGLRDGGDGADSTTLDSLRWELSELNRMYEEAQRAQEDIERG